MIYRALKKEIINKLKKYNKIVILYGPRQAGKTTLSKLIIKQLPYKTLEINADELKFVDVLSSRDLNKLKSLVSGYELLFIDEAQRVPEIGINLKLLIDGLPDLKILVTGSSSLDLAGKITEPLTGRIWTYILYPISYLELNHKQNEFELNDQLEERLIFGSYPEIFSLSNIVDKQQYLEELTRAYLYKDILQLTNIKHASKIRDLLKLLAYQVGNLVSLSELGDNLDMSKDTVASYIDLLEKSFVIFRLKGFSKNLRKEITKMDKIYFFDLGVRNIVIDNLKPLKDRNDHGQLWENFLLIERRKLLAYKKFIASTYFWRTYTGAELDYIEDRNGRLYGFEFKYSRKIAKPPETWFKVYSNSEFKSINQENYLELVLPQ